jgi:lipoprotein-anchoring transpeptidase ErfK/SrfK
MRRLLIAVATLAVAAAVVAVEAGGLDALLPAAPITVTATAQRDGPSPAPAPRERTVDVPTEQVDADARRAEREAAPAPTETAPAAQTAPTETEPTGPTTAAVQQVLADQGYYVGAIDGVDGAGTHAALLAFQKVNGLAADGVVGPATTAALADPRAPELVGGDATRIEVDLTRQVAHLILDGTLVRTFHISSGNGAWYSGGTAQALTPVGRFVIERRIEGVRNAPLGTLYDPLYFHQGWALHGSNSVPAYPASHGCVRMTRTDIVWLADRVTDGTEVVLHGGTHVFAP